MPAPSCRRAAMAAAAAAAALALAWRANAWRRAMNDDDDDDDDDGGGGGCAAARERRAAAKTAAMREPPADETSRPRTIKKLFVYPVKSLRGIEVDEAVIEERGFRHDRRWMVVDEDGTFLSQRRYSRMALVSARVAEEDADGTPRMLELDCDDMPCALRVPVVEGKQLCKVRVWSDHVENAHDQGDNAARWLRRALRTRGQARLVYMGHGCRRPVAPDYAVSETDETSFADGFPFLAISQASLNDLNSRLGSPLDFDRFRPNIVLGGGKPFDEDVIKEISVSTTSPSADLRFRFVKPCARCKITTIDQETAKAPRSLDVDPLRTLATFRKKGDEVFFGQNLLVTSQDCQGKVLKVGQAFKVEELAPRSFLEEEGKS